MGQTWVVISSSLRLIINQVDGTVVLKVLPPEESVLPCQLCGRCGGGKVENPGRQVKYELLAEKGGVLNTKENDGKKLIQLIRMLSGEDIWIRGSRGVEIHFVTILWYSQIWLYSRFHNLRHH